MRRMACALLLIILLTAQAEEIDSLLVHTDELASGFVVEESEPLAVDISPVIRFETDETGVFAVVTVEPLASSEELDTLSIPEDENEPEEPAAFTITSSFTSHSVTYTLTPIGENH